MLGRLLPAAVIAAALLAPSGAQAASPQTLRLDGVGPLALGMSRADAVATGWLSDRGRGCPLGGRPYPVTYRLRGAEAPRGLAGGVEFQDGRLAVMSFRRGVRTEAGITVAKTRLSRFVSAYDALGFDASSAFSATFDGTFAMAEDDGVPVLGAFGRSKVVQELAIPYVPVCE